MKKVIKEIPTVQYYIQRYRGDDIWQKNNYNNIEFWYITFCIINNLSIILTLGKTLLQETRAI